MNRKTGRTSVFFVPPTVTDGDCPNRPENTPGRFGCDSVPTGIAKAKDGTYWISTLGGEAPGAGRLYHVDRWGHQLSVIGGLDSLTGVAVGDDGSIYASQLLYGVPDGLPDNFDPSTIGRILRVAPDGSTWAAQVTMPSGLVFHKGALYASAWSVGIFFGSQNAGQIVKVGSAAWQPVSLT